MWVVMCSKADVWSLACVALEMLTNTPPWSEFKFESREQERSFLSCTKESPRVPGNLSPAGKDFLGRCFARHEPPVCLLRCLVPDCRVCVRRSGTQRTVRKHEICCSTSGSRTQDRLAAQLQKMLVRPMHCCWRVQAATVQRCVAVNFKQFLLAWQSKVLQCQEMAPAQATRPCTSIKAEVQSPYIPLFPQDSPLPPVCGMPAHLRHPGSAGGSCADSEPTPHKSRASVTDIIASLLSV